MFENWLHPLPHGKKDIPAICDFHFGHHILRYTHQIPSLTHTRIALVGMEAENGNAVRDHLYRMSFPFNGLEIADLGNIRKPEIAFVIPLIKELLDSGIFPIIIGEDPNFIQTQYKAFQKIDQLISLAVVDESVPFRMENEETHHAYLNEILTGKRSTLFHLGLIGCQSHFTPPAVFEYLEKRNFECIRLGKAKADLPELEPVIRDADLLGFNLSALKQSEAPGQAAPTPSGFSLEEACQICRYAGLSDKMRSLGIFGFTADNDRRQQTAQGIAQMIWYFIDGFYQRKGDYPISNEGLVEYIVDFKDQDYQITFWKSNRSGRWWIQVPVKTQKKYQRHRLIPCSYADYKQACQQDLPDRLLRAFRRFG